MALNNSLSPTLTFKPLHDNEYLEIATTLLTSTSVAITKCEMQIAESLLYQERTRQCELLPPDKHKAKYQRLQVLPHRKYQALASKLREQVVTCTHESNTLMMIDQTLKAVRAQQCAEAIIDLTVPETTTHPPPMTANEGLIPPSPQIKEEQAATAAPAPTTSKSSTKPPATQKTYHWSRKPTYRLNVHIHDEPFLTTVITQYPGTSPNIPLTCTYDNNPQTTLTAALSILGTTLPTEVLQTMFHDNHTASGSTLTAILKENDDDKYFRFEDYNTAVANKNLTPGLNALFLGHSGPNFGKSDEDTEMFNGSHLILCQINCEAPKTTNQHRTSQWALFSPKMNTVMTCHDCMDNGKTKHAWVLRTELIDFFNSGNQSRIDRRLGKILFPHKADNATDVKHNSADFLMAKSRNLTL
jgi:hypothetical protein